MKFNFNAIAEIAIGVFIGHVLFKFADALFLDAAVEKMKK